MSRPGMKFMDDLEVVACVDLVRGKDAIFAIDFEDGDRDHQVARKLEGVGLCEREIMRHLRGSIWERANSRSMAPKRHGDGRDHRDGEAVSGRSSLADPLRVDRARSGPGPGRHRMRAGLVCSRPALSPHRSVSIVLSLTNGPSLPLRSGYLAVAARNFTTSLLTRICI